MQTRAANAWIVNHYSHSFSMAGLAGTTLISILVAGFCIWVLLLRGFCLFTRVIAFQQTQPQCSLPRLEVSRSRPRCRRFLGRCTPYQDLTMHSHSHSTLKFQYCSLCTFQTWAVVLVIFKHLWGMLRSLRGRSTIKESPKGDFWGEYWIMDSVPCPFEKFSAMN